MPTRPAVVPNTWNNRPGFGRVALVGVALLVVVLVAYSRAIGGEFIWDDDDHVGNNFVLRTLTGLGWIWTHPGATPQYYPLTFTTFWVQYQIWGAVAPPYRIVNILLHVGAAVVLWRTLARLGLRGGLLAACVFALHPVHVESVAWVSERKNTLCGLLFMLSAYAYVRSDSTDARTNPQRARTLYALSLLAFVGAMLSKTVTCALPAILLVVAWWRNGTITRRDVLRTLPMFVVGAALGLFTVLTERSDIGATGPDWQLSFVQRFLIATRAIVFYATKLAWPTNLSFNYECWIVDPHAVWQYAFLMLVALSVVVCVLAARRGRRGPLAAVLVFSGTLLPALGFVNLYPMRYSFVADHFQYLASLGLIVLFSEAVVIRLEGKRTAVRYVVVGIVLVGLAVQTFRHAATFSSSDGLWRATLETNPKSWLAYGNLAGAALERGELEPARADYERMLALKPDAHEGWLGMASYYEKTNRPDDFHAALREAVARAPRSVVARTRLARSFADRGDVVGAIGEYGRALDVSERFAPARVARADLLASVGRGAEAEAEYRKCVELNPELFLPRLRLAVIERRRGNLTGAIDLLTDARAVANDQPMVRSALGILLLEANRNPEARAEFATALGLRSDLPEARKGLAEAERRLAVGR